MVQMRAWGLPPRSVAHAIFWPSGDQDGPDPKPLVCTCPVPSASIVQTGPSKDPLNRWKVMRLPSADHDGENSIAALFVKLVWPDPSGFIVQMSSPRTNAILPF